jgi:hypothetical protein
MSRRHDHIIERFEAWWKIANKSLRLFVENVEKDRCVGSNFGNQFHFLLMYRLCVILDLEWINRLDRFVTTSSLSFLSSILPSPQNIKLGHPTLSLHAMIKSWYWVQHTPSTVYTQCSIHPVQHTLSRVFTQYSIHPVKHTPITAFTEYCIHPLLNHSNIDCLPLSASLSSLSRPCCTQISTFSRLLVNQCIESQLPSRLPPNQLPSSAPPMSLHNGLHVHFHTQLITASKRISRVTWAQAMTVSPSLPDYCLQMYLQSRLIVACMFTWLRPPCAWPTSIDNGLWVHDQTCPISGSMCISWLTRLRPVSAAPNSLLHGLGEHLSVLSI